jgi:hypothetical protein
MSFSVLIGGLQLTTSTADHSPWRIGANQKREVFTNLLEAKVLVEDYRSYYNHHRPHSALGYRTPGEFPVAADLDTKVKEVEKAQELGSVLTLS